MGPGGSPEAQEDDDMFAGMLGGIGSKIAVWAVIAAVAGGLYWHYTVVKGERDAALKQVGALQAAINVQKTTIQDQKTAIKEWAQAQKDMKKTLDALAAAQVQSNETARKLNDVRSKHDLAALSLAKPGLIERRINSGTANVLGMFESATGRGDRKHGRDRAPPRTATPA